MKLRVKREVEARYLIVSAAVRYGDEDMPYDAPLRKGDLWVATINLDSGTIENWPAGAELSFYMKVCDQGTYVLLDADRKEIVRLEEEYVPNSLLPGEYGDYLAMDIDSAGKITNWMKNPSLRNFEEYDE